MYLCLWCSSIVSGTKVNFLPMFYLNLSNSLRSNQCSCPTSAVAAHTHNKQLVSSRCASTHTQGCLWAIVSIVVKEKESETKLLTAPPPPSLTPSHAHAHFSKVVATETPWFKCCTEQHAVRHLQDKHTHTHTRAAVRRPCATVAGLNVWMEGCKFTTGRFITHTHTPINTYSPVPDRKDLQR